MTETLLQDVFSQDYNRLCVIAYRILQDKSLAQDAVQESWLRLCKLKSLDTSDREKVKHLLVLVVRHTAFNMNQRKHPESMEDSAITLLPDNAEMPHEALERREKSTAFALCAAKIRRNRPDYTAPSIRAGAYQ